MNDTVYIDSRETEKRKKRAERLWGEENIEIKKMKCGDYVYKDVGIEFKTVDDFIGSIRDGRIYRQAVSLDETFRKHYIIIYGNVTETLDRRYRIGHSFSMKSYLGAIASVSQITPILCVENENQAFTLANALFEKSTDGKNRKAKKPTIDKKAMKHKNKLVGVLSFVGDINSTRAEKLINELNLKTFEDIINLTEDDIKTVKGFGDKTARNIVEYLK